MSKRELSREELFALVWEKPTRDVAKALGVSDVAISKLCTRLQVPKPPRGYWARVQSGQIPRRPPLQAFREEIDRNRREVTRAKAAEALTGLQREIYRMALFDLQGRGIDVGGVDIRENSLSGLGSDIAAQIMLLIQSHAHDWIKEGKVASSRSHSALRSAADLVAKLLPLARPQLLVFESEGKQGRYISDGPAVIIRFTACLQERIANLASIVREYEIHHLVVPLMATDHAWSIRHIYASESRLFMDSMLSVSATEIWVECSQKAWRDDEPPERITTGRLKLREIMPIDYMPTRRSTLSPTIARSTVVPYRMRLLALREAERIHETMSSAAYTMERGIPAEVLTLADRIWFGNERPFGSAREAWIKLEQELERWEMELEAERSALARSILGVEVGDIVTGQHRGRVTRLSVTGVTLYAGDKNVTFVVSGTRFRKDGTLGKLEDNIILNLEENI